MNLRQQRSVARRLTHRSRSIAVIATLVVAIILAAWLGTEAVLAALGRPPLLLSPAGALDAQRDQPWIAGVTVAVLALAGVTLLVLAFSPARQARHVLEDDRSVIVVDDAILAGALSRAAASAARVPPASVGTALGRRGARVTVTPLSGFPVSEDVVSAAIAEALSAARPRRRVTARVSIDARGAVAA